MTKHLRCREPPDEPWCDSANCDPAVAELLWGARSFADTWPHYGYGGDLELVVRKEFARVQGITFLDHAATTLFADSQVNGFFQDLRAHVYGNPHSHSPSSRLTHDTVEHVRYRILQHFNTNPDSYTVVFTSGCTAALKLVAECFPWDLRGRFSYLTDNHTSVVGMRELAVSMGATALPVTPQEVEGRAGERVNPGDHDTPHLFCCPAQSNFSGRKYPLWHVRAMQQGQLYPSCAWGGRWFVLLDAACLVSCCPLDLQETPADFVSISFYKMFGFPTGIGALIVRNATAAILRKSYFGGGTAAAYLAGEDFYVPAPAIADRFEDGTISFLDIVAVHHGFETLQKLTGGMVRVQLHTFGLARHTYVMLSCLCHGNGQPVAQVYAHSEYEDPSRQGAIVNFNVLDPQGSVVGYSQVDKLAGLYNIQLRTGCFCNTGACQQHLRLSDQQVKNNLQAGHVCGDNIDVIDGQPTGSVRVSFGYMSTFRDCQMFLKFIVDCFVQKPVRLDQVRLDKLRSASGWQNDSKQNLENPQSPSMVDHTSPQSSSTMNPTNSQSPFMVDPTRPQSSSTVDCTGQQNSATVDCANPQSSSTADCTGQQNLYAVDPAGLERVQEEPHLFPGTINVENSDGGNNKGITLSHIFLYPIKSCAAMEVDHWPLGPIGLQYDRLWMVVNINGVCLNQKQEPRLCLIRPRIHWVSRELHLYAPGLKPMSVPLECDQQGPAVQLGQSKVCGDRVQTVDCGDSVASWLSTFLEKPCRLIRQNLNFTRGMRRAQGKDTAGPVAGLSLANEGQYLMINMASVEFLQKHIMSRQGCQAQKLDVQQLLRRFRANLVIMGTEAFEEDDWTQVQIGDSLFQVAGRCERCYMIGIDQDTGARTLEPLLSLSTYCKGKVTFGVYLAYQQSRNTCDPSALCVGCPVSPQLSTDTASCRS
ncbi:molybdenum cofactor sulfurase isoform X2 [Arapaima gigas]